VFSTDLYILHSNGARDLIIKQTNNIDDIKQVLCHVDIYDTISDDNSPESKDYEPPVGEDYRYYAGYVNSVIIGLMIYHPYLDGEECHVQVLPKHREEYAKQFGEQSLSLRDRTRPLYAEIPEFYKNVLDFAKINGFKVIDTQLNNFTKHGKTYNTKVLLWDS
tara:strand:- start:1321 stop:1809 length:489 start_codon:yes stop_codon:yes gene_type:complete